MAKRRKLLTLDQIESELGYPIDYLNNFNSIGSFYSDLTPLSKDSYARAQTELDKLASQNFRGPISHPGSIDLCLPKVNWQASMIYLA